jgi:hypothetical protein
MGVEEDYFLVDPASRTPQPAAAAVVARVVPDLGDLICGEFTRYQAEVKTPPGGRVRRSSPRSRVPGSHSVVASS